MAEHKAKQTQGNVKNEGETLRETATTWTDTIREAAGTIADSAVALQDRNVEYAQSLVDQGFEQIESQAATLRHAFNTLAAQSTKRRAAFRHLMREAVAVSADAFSAPRKAYQETLATMRESVDESTGFKS